MTKPREKTREELQAEMIRYNKLRKLKTAQKKT